MISAFRTASLSMSVHGHQQQFASEIRRVAKALWVQTPAYECPIEPITWPLLSITCHVRFKKKYCVGARCGDGPMSHPEKDRFYGGNDALITKIGNATIISRLPDITERLLSIIPKSHIAIRGKLQGRPFFRFQHQMNSMLQCSRVDFRAAGNLLLYPGMHRRLAINMPTNQANLPVPYIFSCLACKKNKEARLRQTANFALFRQSSAPNQPVLHIAPKLQGALV